MDKTYDFGGWATRNDLLCSDGRTIKRDAFKECDGRTVPLVWNHDHSGPDNVLGHALLKNCPDGVYAYGTFNDTPMGCYAKTSVAHGDVDALSIYANKLVHDGGRNVIHGAIREVSLVLAGANPGAYIDQVLCHGDSDDDAIIYTGESIDLLAEEQIVHSENKDDSNMANEQTGKTVQDVIDSMTDEQRTVLYALVGDALAEGTNGNDTDEDEEEDNMKHNVFDSETNDDCLMHTAVETIITDAKRYGSMKESVLAHSAEYGIDHIDYLFPDDQLLDVPPSFIKRDTNWVTSFMGKVHHSPMSRIKSMHADITQDEARAKGYIKGKRKTEEVFTLLKRTTVPTTVYKKQKFDRDDVIDITDFDVVAWVKSEMRVMLDEEIARACLIGDGRLTSSDDKINEQCIRPIWTDDDLYSIKVPVTVASNATIETKMKSLIKSIIRARKNYKGSGNPTFYTTEDVVTEMLLLEDEMGRALYDSVEKLCTKLRVKEIVTVEVMENQYRTVSGQRYNLCGIVVNPVDYNIGADKGGSINMFDDFDIDYNQQKYLIETRCSGALIKPFSAMVIEMPAEAASTGSPSADATDGD